MSTWATLDQLRTAAADMGEPVPADDAAATRLLERAQDAVEVWGIRARLDDLSGLTDEQLDALAQAEIRQALYLVELSDEYLGPSDVVSVPEITFSREVRPRISPAALEALALHGLIARTGTVLPDPAPEQPPLPWWWWT